MKIRLLPLIALVALTFGLGLAGCKSPEEKACANFKKIAEAAGADDDEMKDEAKCVKEMESMKKECGDKGEEVLECFADMDADNEEKFMEELAKCAAKCEKK